MNRHEPDHIAESDEVSRSQRRREALAVFELAESLVALSGAQLQLLPLSDELREEVERARRVTQQIARKRQTQYLAKQLRRREDELDPIRAALAHDREHSRRESAQLQRLESWREQLVAEGDAALADFLEHFPHADRQQLRKLARQARIEREQNRSPHAFRELFRVLRELAIAGET